MKTDPNVIDATNPLNFLGESPRVWSDARVSALVRLAPQEFKTYAAEIQEWRELRTVQSRAAAAAKRSADEIHESRRIAAKRGQ